MRMVKGLEHLKRLLSLEKAEEDLAHVYKRLMGGGKVTDPESA